MTHHKVADVFNDDVSTNLQHKQETRWQAAWELEIIRLVGWPIWYANEPNLHNISLDPSRDTYTKLRHLQSELLTVNEKASVSEAKSAI